MPPKKLVTKTIKANPTKELFINVLTMDINLQDCILDLLDNSVDSYLRNEITDRRKIVIDITSKKFEIFDNCGGIEQDFLINNVFIFGVKKLSRPHPTLGVYGIGLKRAFFKIGKHLTMETDSGKKYSKVILDVDDWKKKKKWEIPFSTGSSKLNKREKPYTKIIIEDLHEDVKRKFEIDPFIEDLRASISITYSLIIDRKIDIILNSKEIEPFHIDFRYDKNYSPLKVQRKFNGVNALIVCGINPRKSRAEKIERLGWNIFCNDRLVVRDDRTESTGWTGEKTQLPKYHPIYNEFKGFVFLKSKDPSKLPLNTTKTGLTTEAKIYQDLLNEMIKQARPVIDYLGSKYIDEKDKLEEIEEEVEENVEEEPEEEKESVEKIKIGSKFLAPVRKKPKIDVVNIQYKKPKGLVEKVKKKMKVRSASDVGKETFDYYIELEGIENE